MIYGIRIITKNRRASLRTCDAWVSGNKHILIFDSLEEAEAEAAQRNKNRATASLLYEAKENPPHLHRLAVRSEGWPDERIFCTVCGDQHPRIEPAVKLRGRLCRKCTAKAKGLLCGGLEAVVGSVDGNLIWHITSGGNSLCGAGTGGFFAQHEGDYFLETLAVDDPDTIMSAG